MNAVYESMLGLIQWMPTWGAAIVLLLAGWCVALLARLLVARVLALLSFNRLCERAHVTQFLEKGQVNYTPAQLVGAGTFWVLLLVTLVRVGSLLEIGVLDTFSSQLEARLPDIFGAILVLVVGGVMVSFIANFVHTLSRNAGLAYADLVQKIMKGIGVVLVLALAGEQLNLGHTIVASAFLIVLGATSLAAALAFGLGCKDIARVAMEKLLANLKERHRVVKGSDLEG